MYFGKTAIFALVLGTSAFASPPERDRHHFSVASSKFICLERNNPCRYYEECCEDLICKNQKCQPKPICQSKNKPCGSIIGNKCCDGLFCAKTDVCKERQRGKLELFRVFAGASGRYDGGPDKRVIDLGYDLAMSASGDCIAFPIFEPNSDHPRRVFVECIDYSTRAMAVTLPQDPRNSVITNDLFYDSMKVTMSGNGLVIAIGAYYAEDYVGMVATYELKEGTWVEISAEFELPDDTVYFGMAIALSHDGTKMVVTAADYSGPAENGFFQRYRLEEGSWIIEGDTVYGKSADQMGNTIGMNSDGSRIIVNGSARYVEVYDWSDRTNEWSLVHTFGNKSGNEYFGYHHNEISSDGSVVAIGDYEFDSGKGSVEIFEEDQNGKFKSIFSVVGPGENSAYGYAFALSGDGKFLAVSDYEEKENIVIYKRVGKTFVKQQIVKKEGTQTDTVRLNYDGTVLAFENNGYRGLQRYELKMEMHVYAIPSPTPSPTEKPTDTPTVPYVPPTSSPAPSS